VPVSLLNQLNHGDAHGLGAADFLGCATLIAVFAVHPRRASVRTHKIGGVRKQVLVPTLRKGDIVFMDNLRRRRGLQETCS
jgi:hypothetical protein